MEKRWSGGGKRNSRKTLVDTGYWILDTGFKKPILLSAFTLTITDSRHTMPQIINLKPQTSNLKPQTSNLKPQTPNLKPQTSNLKPQTSNLKPH